MKECVFNLLLAQFLFPGNGVESPWLRGRSMKARLCLVSNCSREKQSLMLGPTHQEVYTVVSVHICISVADLLQQF